MSETAENNKNPAEIIEPNPYDLKVKTLKKDTNSKNFFTMADDAGTLFADDVKVFCDDNTRICTLVFIKKRVKAKMDGRAITLDAIHYEEVMEIKLPYTTAFLLARYMTEIYKQIQAGGPKQFHFGPTGVV